MKIYKTIIRKRRHNNQGQIFVFFQKWSVFELQIIIPDSYSHKNQYPNMCFLPVKCLKVIVFVGSICSIAISVGLLALTIYVQVEKKTIISTASQGAVTASLIGLYISSIVFLLLGVAGLAGSLKSSKRKENKGTCLLALYSFGIFVFFVIFLGGTIFFFVGPEAIFGTDCTQGSKTDLINNLYATSDEAYKVFCTDNCPCQLDTGSELYNELTTTVPAFNFTGNATKFADCPTFNSTTENIDVLAAIEELLNCGGWCPLNNSAEADPASVYYYRFRNINDCSTADCYTKLNNCHDEFQKFMTGSGKIVGFGCLIALLVCFVNIIAVCCICYHPSKVKSGSNFYSRMIEMD